MLNVALCDDDGPQLERLYGLISEYLEQSGEHGGRLDSFSDGEALLNEAAKCGGYDIYIIDILMPGLNGIRTAQALREQAYHGEIIFLSSANDYAADSYGVGAFYYLLKPPERGKLFEVMDRAGAKARSAAGGILVNTRDGVRRILLDSILYAERRGRALRYCCADCVLDSTTIRTSLRDAARPLLNDRRFYLCGASYVLNMQRITGICGQSVTFDTGRSISLPRTAAADFKAAWGAFWLSGGTDA